VWGLYGQTAVETPKGWRTVLTLAAVALAVIWAATRRWRRPTADGLRFGLLALVPLLLAAGAMHASWAVFHRNNEVRGLLGRYIYAGLPVLAAGVAASLGALAIRICERTRARGDALLAGFVVVSALAGLAGFVRAMHGFYGTRSLGLLLERAGTVTVSSGVGRWLALIGAGWLVAIIVATTSLLRREPDRPADLDPGPVFRPQWSAAAPPPRSAS
jgi:hypothetical protein